MANTFKPYVPNDTNMKELTLRAIILGIFLSMILGAANAYLGLKAGMTVAATFPAAVVAMAVLRVFKGSILEENIARTTGAVGEALAAGAIFTLPAFIMAGVWDDFDYFTCTAVMLVGGILGVLFVVILRRTLVNDTELPFPESKACAEIVKSGQKGSTGAKYVFGSLGLAALLEFCRNANGLTIIKDHFKGFFDIGDSGTMVYQTSSASPALMSVGYIIGPKLASITFSGGVFGWLFLMPLLIFFKGGPEAMSVGFPEGTSFFAIAKSTYSANIKPVAVGAMLIGAIYTLFRMRKSLFSGIKRSVTDIQEAKKGGKVVDRVEKDFNFGRTLIAIGIIFLPMIGLYYWLTSNAVSALVAAVVMLFAGFLFAAVAGYLVGIIGSSSNPISGLTLSTLLIAAVLMVALGMKGNDGVAAVLGVAAVVCCVAGVAGDMIQDWKVGHILGGTPWKMQVGGLIGVVAAALVLIFPLILLHKFGGGIGSDALPAPQAGLMADMSVGIVGGDMNWMLVISGMLFAVGLICIGFTSPMLVAIGMYLPFYTVSAIFAGGLVKWLVDRHVQNKHGPKALGETPTEEEKKTFAEKDSIFKKLKEKVENTGLLLASGLVAGEALCGILIAGLVGASLKMFCSASEVANGEVMCLLGVRPESLPLGALNIVIIALISAVLIYFPIKSLRNAKQKS